MIILCSLNYLIVLPFCLTVYCLLSFYVYADFLGGNKVAVHLFSAPSSFIYLVVTGKVYTCLNEGNDPPNEGVAMET